MGPPCTSTGVSVAGCEQGVGGVQATLSAVTARALGAPSGGQSMVTGTSGWFSFNLLDPGDYIVSTVAPPGSWWTPTTAEVCNLTLVSKWDELHCNVGYRWGSPWGVPAASGTGATTAAAEIVLMPVQDTTLHGWETGNHGGEDYLVVRQPGVASATVQFDLTAIPAGATIVSARLRLYSPFASNDTSWLYMTAYPLDKAWAEGEATWADATATTPWAGPGAVSDHTAPVGWGWMSAPGSPGAPGWVEFDIDPAALPANAHGFLIRGEGSEDRKVAYSFFSREYGNPGVWPQLVVQYTAP